MEAKKRNFERKLLNLLEWFPAIAIVGPRQAGKTTLAKKVKKNWSYFDLENIDTLNRISSDPNFFFSQNPSNLILDEAQIYPDLFKILRGVIDGDRKKMGRFILTGSSSPELLKNISESLPGRIAVIELGTFKFNEWEEKELSPFYTLFDKGSPNELIESNYKIENNKILNFWYKGSFPDPSLMESDNQRSIWMDNYISTYINRDIKNLFPRIDSVKFQRFLLMLFKLSGTIINKRELSQLIEVSEPSIKDYLDIIHGTFIWRKITPFEHNIKKIITKMPKGHVRDSGLLHHALKLTSLANLMENPIVGKSFESFVIEEILKGIESTMVSNWTYHFYRTKSKVEIDLILHGPFGIIPIEIKFGMRIDQRKLSNLKTFIEEHKLPFGILVNNNLKVEWISEKVLQIPVGFL